ncbi:MAG: CapA family protein [Sphaerochaetaceae bacterium]|nr:CapA family protein [Sphaerochaetaceae bacterium]
MTIHSDLEQLSSIDILLFGDFCPYNAGANSKLRVGPELKRLMEQAQFRAVNLECPITESEQKIVKSGPHLKAPPNSVALMKELGISICSLANNHILDYTHEGIEDTCEALDDVGIIHFGLTGEYGKEYELIEINNKRVSLLSFTENEFSTDLRCGVAANALDPAIQFSHIHQAKHVSDFVIIQFHGGVELYPYPTPEMQKYARFMIDIGADCVICHHSHIVSGYEEYKGKPIAYSLGNFFFPEAGNSDSWYKGLVAAINIEDRLKVDFFMTRYCMETGVIDFVKDEEFKGTIVPLNQVIANPEVLASKWDALCQSLITKTMMGILRPPRIMRLMIRFGLLPNYIRKRTDASLLNLIRCESHRYKLITTIRIQEEKKNVGRDT